MAALNPLNASVLVVDDEEIIRTALSESLRREGYDVMMAGDGESGLKILEDKSFSVILTDQLMPGMNGLEFLERTRVVQPDATRVLITGVPNLGTVIDSINKGEIFRFIVKPWLREELLATVRNGVQRFETLRQNQELQAKTQIANKELARQLTRIAEQNLQLENLNAALHRNLNQSVQLCLKTIEAYWPVLSNQARRVQELCRTMAETLDLPPAQRHVLDIASLLHDIGLIGVPRDLLRKWRMQPDSLNDAEVAQIEHHPVLGQQLVGFVDNLADVGRTIRAHHEHFDGTGYPDRLYNDNIPWLARLLAIAVGYATFPNEDGAPDYIRANSGFAYDPEAVRAFFRSLPHASLPRRRREVLLSELRPGMILAEGIYSASGLLLMSQGQKLSEPYIDKLRNHDRVNPINHSLIVFG